LPSLARPLARFVGGTMPGVRQGRPGWRPSAPAPSNIGSAPSKHLESWRPFLFQCHGPPDTTTLASGPIGAAGALGGVQEATSFRKPEVVVPPRLPGAPFWLNRGQALLRSVAAGLRNSGPWRRRCTPRRAGRGLPDPRSRALPALGFGPAGRDLAPRNSHPRPLAIPATQQGPRARGPGTSLPVEVGRSHQGQVGRRFPWTAPAEQRRPRSPAQGPRDNVGGCP